MADDEFWTWDDPRVHWDMVGLYFDSPLPSYISNPPDLSRKGIKHAMRLPDDRDQLETRGFQAAAGCQALEDTIPLVKNRAAITLVDARAFADSRIEYDRADGAVSRAFDQLEAAGDTARPWLMVVKDVLSKTLGKKWSSLWAEAGWNENNLAVPKKVEEFLPILRAQVAYLDNHPEAALADPRYNYTPAKAAEMLALVEFAMNNTDTTGGKILGVNPAKSAFEAAGTTRDLCEEALRRRLRGLYSELEQSIPATSEHWLTFGFDQPGAVNPPGEITDFTGEALSGGRNVYRWTNAPRATYTQIWLLNAEGIWERRETISGGTEITLEGFTAGQLVKAKLRAGNETSYGPFTAELPLTAA